MEAGALALEGPKPRPPSRIPACIVLALLPTRLSNAEIAEQLGVSLNTIKTHLKHVYRKFDVVGRTEAVDAAERLHLL